MSRRNQEFSALSLLRQSSLGNDQGCFFFMCNANTLTRLKIVSDKSVEHIYPVYIIQLNHQITFTVLNLQGTPSITCNL